MSAKSESAAPFINKDLAIDMRLSVRSVKRWAKRLNVKPTVQANACQRWSAAARDEFLRRWKAYRTKRKK